MIGCPRDRKSTPADIAAARIDIPSFFATLTPREREIAEILATGESTSSAAEKFRVSAARISQLRRRLHEKWQQFHGEAIPGAFAASGAC
jgi:FixJ family two-component response regulator